MTNNKFQSTQANLRVTEYHALGGAAEMKYKTRKMTLELTVTVPILTAESEVERAINAALDEPPCEWGDWIVGGVTITKVSKS